MRACGNSDLSLELRAGHTMVLTYNLFKVNCLIFNIFDS